LTALKSFLAGNDMVVYFNHNQTNSGGAIDQDIFVWAQLKLVDDQGVLPTLFYYVAATPNTIGPPGGIPNFGQPGAIRCSIPARRRMQLKIPIYRRGWDVRYVTSHGHLSISGVGTGTGGPTATRVSWCRRRADLSEWTRRNRYAGAVRWFRGSCRSHG